jgi:hypothetical protein
MAPGTYLQLRREAAGYTLSMLAHELLLVTGFGQSRAESDFRCLRLTLIAAEEGRMPHKRDRIELIRAFVPLDVSLYLHLVECEQSGDPYRVDGICAVCACSFHDPCVLHVGPTAALGSSACRSGSEICSACEQSLERLTPGRPASSSAAVGQQERPTIAQQLRALGDRMQRLSAEEDRRAAAAPSPATEPFLRVVQSDRPLPLTEALLRPIPVTGDN